MEVVIVDCLAQDNVELGQALLDSPMGEGYGGVGTEVDLDGGEEAYRRAIELAEQLGDDRTLAGALREVGTVAAARLRTWLAEGVRAGRGFELGRRFANGESVG